MNILILEDEQLAAERLTGMILTEESSAKIIGQIESIKKAIKWFNENNLPDLCFMDIQLADGLCFEIFEKVPIDIPVIFTTAYNEYALRAFKVNSIDYLLKPISDNDLKQALTKFKKLHGEKPQHTEKQLELFQKVYNLIKNPYRTRYIIRIGEHIKAINCDDVAFFYSSEKATYLRTVHNRDYGLEDSLDQVEIDLDPAQFYRVNRKQIIALQVIQDIIAYSGNRLRVVIKGNEQEEIIVSREKVTAFKKWLEGRN